MNSFIFFSTARECSRNKNLMLISREGECFSPYYLHLSKNVIRFASKPNCSYYPSVLSKLDQIKKRIKHFPFETEKDLIETTMKFDKTDPFADFSTIVAFEHLSHETSTELLKLGTRDAIMIIMDPVEGFQKYRLNSNGELSVEILANSQQVRCDNFV